MPPALTTTLAPKGIPARVVDVNKDVWAWGSTLTGLVGDGSLNTGSPCDSDLCVLTPKKIAGLGSVEAIASGASGVALKSDGTVWTWGGNKLGTLGHAPNTAGDVACTQQSYCSATPQQVKGLP